MSQVVTKSCLYQALILLWFSMVVASKVHYIIGPSQSPNCSHQCDSNESNVDNIIDLTLSQFVNSSIDYLTNNTRLIFSPGNYNLESELIIKNVHSFSIFVNPISSAKAVINCDQNSRFEFRNVGIVTINGLEFVGCFENYVASVKQLHLENVGFFGYDQRVFNGTVMIIEESAAYLDRTVMAFISVVTALQEPPQNCNATILNTDTMDRMTGILLKRSTIRISQSQFENNSVGHGRVIHADFGSNITIVNSTFVNNSANDLYVVYAYFCSFDYAVNNTGGIVYASGCGSVQIYDSTFVQNTGVTIFGDNGNVLIIHTTFIDNSADLAIVHITGIDLVIGHSTFINNAISRGFFVLYAANTNLVSITHSEFVDNTATFSLVHLDGAMITVTFSKFINNKASQAVVFVLYYITSENLTNNVLINNSVAYEVYISSSCRPDLSLSLGSARCIQCTENWHWKLIGIVVAAFIAGIALVILMLALNMTVAVGTLNGILFYVHIVAANADTYFLPFTTPDFITVFISWLNLDIGFDVCFFVRSKGATPTIYDGAQMRIYKALLQLVFPAYIIVLVIIVIVASECSSKFAKIIGKGNPVAVLTTMILLSCAKFFDAILTSISLLYLQPARGSSNIDVTKLGSALAVVEQTNNTDIKAASYFLLLISILIFLFGVIYTALVFSWQWLLQYQDKTIFKWVKYQKLHHFLEPYHAPYTAKYRYWTGLLLLARVFLYLILVLNFSLDPRAEFMSTIFIVGGLILLKGATAKRVYKNWPLDVMETAIYFNLVAFSALTWYNLDFGGNQVAVAYTSVMIIFILLVAVIIFHVLRFTRLYKCSLVEKAFQKNPKCESSNDEELDGYQLYDERSADHSDQELSTITHSTVEIHQPCQND